MNGIDCATKLNATSTGNIKAAGIGAVGRYLGLHSWKGITPDEVKAIQDGGLAIFLIYETSPTNKEYFSYSKGRADAQEAFVELQALSAPQGLAVYFAVDYDAQAGDMSAICEYFKGIHDGIGGKYLVGAYGSFDVLTALEAHGEVAKYYQTYAWSHGKVFSHNSEYQYQNGVTIGGVQVDKDQVSNTIGLWMPPVTPKPQPKPAPAGGVYAVRSGDTLSEIAVAHGTTVAVLASLNHIGNPNLIHPGDKIALPGGHAAAPAPAHSGGSCIVKRGDTLSSIAAAHGTTVAKLVGINGIKNPDLIYPGQIIKLP